MFLKPSYAFEALGKHLKILKPKYFSIIKLVPELVFVLTLVFVSVSVLTL